MPTDTQGRPDKASRATIRRRLNGLTTLENPFPAGILRKAFDQKMSDLLAGLGVARLGDLKPWTAELLYRFVLLGLWIAEDDAARLARFPRKLAGGDLERYLSFTNRLTRIAVVIGAVAAGKMPEWFTDLQQAALSLDGEEALSRIDPWAPDGLDRASEQNGGQQSMAPARRRAPEREKG